MTKSRSIAILAELLAVVRKYERSEVVAAIQALENPEWRSEIIKTLSALSELQNATKNRNQPKQGKGSKRSSRDYFNDFVIHLRGKENLRREQIEKFIESIATRKLLQNAGALRDFAAFLNVKTDAKLDRWVVARRIGEVLADQSTEEVDRLLGSTEQFGGESSSLQAWSDVIVKKGR